MISATTRRRMALVLACAAAAGAPAAACTDRDASGTASTMPAPSEPSTTADSVPADSAASTTSSSAPSTTVATSSTTSTIPAVEGLELSAGGLGAALFGAEAESVVDYVTSILGAPSTDSGWIDPFAIGAACPGSEIRFMEWDDLRLFFSDQTTAASGLRHFASFSYGPAFGPVASPYGLATERGIRLGSTVRELRTAHPGGLLSPGDEVVAPSYQIEEGFVAYVTEAVGAGIVRSFEGGFGCSE